jgi:hypothetical protein
MPSQRYFTRLTAVLAINAATILAMATLAQGQEATNRDAKASLPTAYFHPNVLYFKVGTMSSQTTMLTNTSAGTLKITSFSLQGLQQNDFAFTTSCPFSLAAGASCAVTLTGVPAGAGPIGRLVESDNSAAGHHYVSLRAN